MMTGHFVEICKRRSLKENADKRMVMAFGEEDSVCEVSVD